MALVAFDGQLLLHLVMCSTADHENVQMHFSKITTFKGNKFNKARSVKRSILFIDGSLTTNRNLSGKAMIGLKLVEHTVIAIAKQLHRHEV